MPSLRLQFENNNGFRLAANLDQPDRQPIKAIAIYAHCFTCSKNLKTVIKLFDVLTAEGIAVFRFDFTGIGMSEGRFTETNFSSNIQDVLSAGKFLVENYTAPRLLIGHSLGAAAVLKAGPQMASVNAIVTIGASHSPSHLGTLLNKTRNEAEQLGQADVQIGGQRYTLNRNFFHNLERHNMSDAIANLGKPLLILHSPEDKTVPIEHASQIYKQAKHPKSFVSLSPADHLLSDPADAHHAGRIIAGWASKYIEN